MFFLGYEFLVVAVWGAVCTLFTKIHVIALKTSVKSVTVAFIVKFICKIKTEINNMNVKCVML